YGLKCISSRFDLLVEPALRRGIDAVGEQPFCFLAFVTGRFQRDRWIGSDSERLLLAAEAISQAPKLAPVWRDQKIEPTAIREFDWPLSGLRGAYSVVVEHVGIALVEPTRYQQKYQ